jgi:polyisoprenoid-binding protein YceI
VTALAAALALVAAAAAEREMLSVDAAASVVRFHVDHKLHVVDGASRAIEGKAVIEPDGRVLAMVRIPVASFDTGDGNRDSNMRETLEASRHPYVVFKGVTRLGAPPSAGKPTKAVLDGELDFHGVKRRLEVPVTVERGRDGSADVRGELAISLDAYRVERPSLLFVKLEDACTIRFELKLRRSP